MIAIRSIDLVRRTAVMLLWTLLFVSALASIGQAQLSDAELANMSQPSNATDDGASKSASNEMNFLSLLIKGGWFMIPIGVVSLVVVTVFFDRLIGLRTNRLMPRRFRKGLVALVRQNEQLDPRAVYKLCTENGSAAARVVRSVVLKTGRPNAELMTAVQEAAQREADRAYSNVRWLNLASGVAPLLGLLGTVWGLIRAFHDMTLPSAGQNRAEFLAVGIYEALITTMAGLIVAIPSAIASHYFEGRITVIMGRIEELASEIIPKLERFEGKTRFEPIGRELAPRDIASTASAPPVHSGEPHKSRSSTNTPRVPA